LLLQLFFVGRDPLDLARKLLDPEGDHLSAVSSTSPAFSTAS
jgi:hypothetical protein